MGKRFNSILMQRNPQRSNARGTPKSASSRKTSNGTIAYHRRAEPECTISNPLLSAVSTLGGGEIYCSYLGAAVIHGIYFSLSSTRILTPPDSSAFLPTCAKSERVVPGWARLDSSSCRVSRLAVTMLRKQVAYKHMVDNRTGWRKKKGAMMSLKFRRC